MNKTYELSGKKGNIFTLGLAAALPFGFLLSLLYSYISVYNPIIYVAVIVWLAYGAGIVLIVSTAVKFSECRDVSTAMVVGTVLGGIFLYASWASFIHVFLGMNESLVSPGLLELFMKPTAVFSMAEQIRMQGWYEVFGVRPTGFFLTLIWLVEAAGIVGAGFVGGHASLDEQVYCESCKQWAKDMEKKLSLSFPHDNVLLQKSIQGDVELLLDLPLAQKNESPQLRVNLKSCRGCKNTTTLDFDQVVYTQDEEGKWDDESEDLSPVFVLSSQQMSKFVRKRLGTV